MTLLTTPMSGKSTWYEIQLQKTKMQTALENGLFQSQPKIWVSITNIHMKNLVHTEFLSKRSYWICRKWLKEQTKKNMKRMYIWWWSYTAIMNFTNSYCLERLLQNLLVHLWGCWCKSKPIVLQSYLNDKMQRIMGTMYTVGLTT